MNLSHLDENHKPKMVDVSDKKTTKRKAIASGYITISKEAFENVENDKNKKGPVLQTAIISAIMGAKKTHEIIPMCHPLMLSGIKCDIEKNTKAYQYKLIVEVKNSGQTGVEMEALSAVSIGLLTIYDMLKAIDKSMIISNICLEEKKGGNSGDFKRDS